MGKSKDNAIERQATFTVEGTRFSIAILPLKLLSKGMWAKTEISIENEWLHYKDVGEYISREELDQWIVAMFRLLAGGYATEYSLSFEKAGIAVDFYPYTKNGEEASRQERRDNDCVMAIRLLMRSKDKKRLLGGVYSLLLHRDDIEKFATELRKAYDEVFEKFKRGKGEYLFVGVSPRGYHGCNYWYLDPTNTVQAGDYVWVRMGRHNLEQIAYVDDVRYCTEETAPYNPLKVKRILRKAMKDEL